MDGNRLGNPLQPHIGPKDGSELLLVALDLLELAHDVLVRLSHRDRILDRPNGLLLQGARTAIPELHVIEHRIIDSVRLTPTHTASDPDGRLVRIGKSGPRVMTKGTGARATLRQAAIKVELLPELDFRLLVQIRGRRRNRRRE